MLSRVADSLYWMARYSERTESNAHILSMQLIRMLEESETKDYCNCEWNTILDICSSRMDYNQYYTDIRTLQVVEYMAFSEENTNSLVNLIGSVRENAKVVRDCIPTDLWEVWNELYLQLEQERSKREFSLLDIHAFLQKINTTSMVATGIVDSVMSRELAYHFIKIGKWLERGEKTARILQAIFQKIESKQNSEEKLFDGDSAVLLINGCGDYSNKYRFEDPNEILQFLVSDRTFPRSIAYCMEHVKKSIMQIESEKVAHYSFEMFLTIEELITTVKNVKMEQLTFEEQYAYITELLKKCIMFSKIFATTYYLVEVDSNK